MIDVRKLQRTSPCVRCGVARFRVDGKNDFPVCGWCAAKEILQDQTWAHPSNSQSIDLWEAAREFVGANTTAVLINELCATKAEVAELRRRTGIKELVAA